MSWRDSYGEEGYGEGDVLGFYISLPDGERYEPQVNLNNKGKPFLVQGQDAQAHVPGECVSNSSFSNFFHFPPMDSMTTWLAPCCPYG